MAVGHANGFDVASVILMAVSATISGFMLRLQRRLAQKVDAEKLIDRVEALERHAVNTPNDDDVTAIISRIGGVEGSVRETMAQNNAIIRAVDVLTRQVEIVQRHLLNREDR